MQELKKLKRQAVWCREALLTAKELRDELAGSDLPLTPPGIQAVVLGRLVERLWAYGFEPDAQVLGSADIPALRNVVRWAVDRVWFHRPTDLEDIKERAFRRWAEGRSEYSVTTE